MGTTPIVTDAALVAAVADGDMTALRELYERHGAWLHARLIRRCNDPEVVVEVVQDTFVALWKDARRFRGDGEVGAWLWGIAFRRMVSRLRARRDVVLIPEWDVSPALQQVMPSAEDQVLLGVEYGDLAAGAATPVARVPLGRAGRRARRADHQGGGTTARRPREHREDAAPPREGTAARTALTEPQEGWR